MKEGILGAFTARSLWFNGLLVPVERSDSILALYTDHLVEIIHNETYPISLAGSATLITYRGRFLAVCTLHQIEGRDHRAIGLIERSGKEAISCGGKAHFTVKGTSDFSDLAFFDFTAPCDDGAIDKRRFFDFQTIPPDSTSDAIAFFVCGGFPYKDQNYELEEKRHLGSTKRIIVCTLDGASSDPVLLRLKPVEPLTFDPDGMSGGSAFVCIIVDGEARAFFGGIIVRAGRDAVHIVKAGYIRQFLNLVIDAKSQPTDTNMPDNNVN